MTPEEKAREIVDKAWGRAPHLELEDYLVELIAQALTQPTITEEEIEKISNEWGDSPDPTRPNTRLCNWDLSKEDIFKAGFKAALAKMKGETK